MVQLEEELGVQRTGSRNGGRLAAPPPRGKNDESGESSSGEDDYGEGKRVDYSITNFLARVRL